MPKVNESTLVVNLGLQGRSLFTEIKSWNIDSDYLSTTDGFSIACHARDRSKVLGLEMQPVEMMVSGSSQLLGRIELSTIGNDGGAVSYSGRDYLAEMVGCAIDPTVAIKGEMDLFTVITAVAGPVGIDTVLSDSDIALRSVRSGKPPTGETGKAFQALKVADIKPEFGSSMFAFLSRVVARHGATIQPATSRNAVILAAPSYDQTPLYRIQRHAGYDASGNNVISGVATRDFTAFPTHAIFNGSQVQPEHATTAINSIVGVGVDTRAALAAQGLGAGAGVAALVYSAALSQRAKKPKIGSSKQFDTATVATGFAPAAEEIILNTCHVGRQKPSDGTGDPLTMYRLLAVRDDRSRNQEQLDRLAVREVGGRLKLALVYDVTVQGHVDPVSGAVWSVDTMANVSDELAGISEPMWIASRSLRYDPKSGATTSMKLWRPGAFLT